VYSHHFHDENFVEKNDVLVECFRLIAKTEAKFFFEQLGLNAEKYLRFSEKAANKPQIDYQLKLVQDRLCKFLQLIYKNQLPFAHGIVKDSQVKLLKHTQQVSLDLHFIGNNQNIDYQLKLSIENQNIDLRNCNLTIIHQHPAWCIISDYLVHLPEIKASFLTPFQTKESIITKQEKFDSYLKKIVAPLMESSQISIHTQGIPTNQISEPTETSFTIETHFQNKKWLVCPRHHYGRKSFPAGKTDKKIFSSVEIKNNRSEIQQIIRNWEVEAEHLRDLIGDFSLQNGFFELPAKSLFDVQTWLKGKLKVLPKHVKFKGWYYQGKLVNIENHQLSIITINQNKDWFDLEVRVKVGEIEIAFKEIAKSILEGKDVHLLENGEYFIIPTVWKAKVDAIEKHAENHGAHWRLPAVKWHVLEDSSPQPDAVLGVEIAQTEYFTYRAYQIEGVRQMLMARERQKGFLLADEMGLGKTLQVLGVLASLQNAGVVGKPSSHTNVQPGLQLSLFEEFPTSESNALPALIVVPPALIINWYRESQRFFPNMRASVHAGPNRSRKTEELQQHDLIISSYHTIREDVQMFKALSFSVLVLDEAHYIKNPQSQIYEAVKSIPHHFSIALTGTPIENNLKDLWSIFSVIEPQLLDKYAVFNKQYRLPIESEKDEFSLEQLKHLLSPFMLRRTKSLVAQDLPPLVEQVVFSEMTEEQDAFYVKTKSKVRNALLEAQLNEVETNINIHILNGLTRLRQIANHPQLVQENIESGKFAQIISDIQQILDSQKRVLVFSTFTTYLDLIKSELEKASIESLVYTGALNTKERQKIIDEFSASSSSKVLLMSLKAGGVGLNLTQADYVLIADPWWNPQAENQAIARAHRIGRTETVTVKKYISIGTIEEKIHQLQQQKIELSEEILAIAEENHSLKISREAMLELID
jgi:SNF2 family DNA or RNA helicase